MSTLQQIVDDVASTVHCVTSTANVLTAVDEMCRFDAPLIVVRNDDATLGVISKQDILARVIRAGLDPSTTAVADVMTPKVVCVDVDETLEEAGRVMQLHGCRYVVILRDGDMVGVLSAEDIARWSCDDRTAEVDSLREYVSGAYPPARV